MTKLEQNHQQSRHTNTISADNLLSLGFRITTILTGLALLFVAAIYYGIINP